MTPGADNVPPTLRELYEVHDFRHAAAILATEFPAEFADLCDALSTFRITEGQVLKPGGNESDIPKAMSKILRPRQWVEAKLKAALVVDDEPVTSDSHKIDYIKGRVAFDFEWNSKDQTFDRDLYAFRAFYEYNRISVGVICTRSRSLDAEFKRLDIMGKYGASTTHVGKLLPRLQAGRAGGCPVLVFGITDKLLIAGDQ